MLRQKPPKNSAKKGKNAAKARPAGALLEAFSIKLPSLSPTTHHIVFPPAPPSHKSSPEQDARERLREPSPFHLQNANSPQLPPTPPSEPSELPPPRYAQTTLCSVPKCQSFEEVLATGYKLHPCIVDDYNIIEELGAGGYGLVLKAMRKRDRALVAVKMMWRDRMPADHWVVAERWDAKYPMTRFTVPKEAFILRTLQHPGIIGYIDYFEDEIFSYLVMEYFGTPWNDEAPEELASRSPPVPEPVQPKISPINRASRDDLVSPRTGSLPTVPTRPGMPLRRSSCDLFECLESHDYMSEDLARYVFKQIVNAVCYLHSTGVVHADLKDENIVIDANYRVKLIDFGSALLLDRQKEAPYHENFKGTLNFASPEILRGELYQAPQAEIWALGCILCVLLTGRAPFETQEQAANGQVSEPAIPMSRKSFSLMMGCLCFSPTARLTAAEVQEHPWFRC